MMYRTRNLQMRFPFREDATCLYSLHKFFPFILASRKVVGGQKKERKER